jgi:hypothetical protein
MTIRLGVQMGEEVQERSPDGSVRISRRVTTNNAPTRAPKSVQRDEVPLPRVWGCPPTPFSPSPKNGGQGVDDPLPRSYPGTFRGDLPSAQRSTGAAA